MREYVPKALTSLPSIHLGKKIDFFSIILNQNSLKWLILEKQKFVVKDNQTQKGRTQIFAYTLAYIFDNPQVLRLRVWGWGLEVIEFRVSGYKN